MKKDVGCSDKFSRVLLKARQGLVLINHGIHDYQTYRWNRGGDGSKQLFSAEIQALRNPRGCIKFLESYYLILVTKRRQIGSICGHAIYGIEESQLITIPHSSVQTDLAHSKTELRYKKLFYSVDLTKDFFYSYTYPIMQSLQKNVLCAAMERMPYEMSGYQSLGVCLLLLLFQGALGTSQEQVEKRPREMMLRREFANAVGYLNQILSEESRLKFIHWDFHKFAKSKSANVLAVLGGVASEALDLTGFYYSGKPSAIKKRVNQLSRTITARDTSVGDFRSNSSVTDLGKMGNSNESGNFSVARDGEREIEQLPKKNDENGREPRFQSGVLRTNCIDCLDRTNVAQFAYGLAALGRQLHAMGLSNVPKVDPDSSVAAALMDMVFTERQGKWKATTQSREFLKSIKRYYSNAYTDGEKQDAINLFLGYFQPQEGKPALWELDSDYYLHVGGNGDEAFTDNQLLPTNNSTVMAQRSSSVLAPVPACIEDFSRMKLTSFDKLMHTTCSSIKNVRICSEPDLKVGFPPGNFGTAPDAAEIQLKSPNWLFGQRKVEETGPMRANSTQDSVDNKARDETAIGDCCEFKWLSSRGDSCEEDIFERYLTIAATTEIDNWYGSELLFDTVEDSEAYRHYAECCQGPALDPFEQDAEKEQYYYDALHQVVEGVKDTAIVSEMETALNEYDEIGSDLGSIVPSKSVLEDPSSLTRWILGEEKMRTVKA